MKTDLFIRDAPDFPRFIKTNNPNKVVFESIINDRKGKAAALDSIHRNRRFQSCEHMSQIKVVPVSVNEKGGGNAPPLLEFQGLYLKKSENL